MKSWSDITKKKVIPQRIEKKEIICEDEEISETVLKKLKLENNFMDKYSMETTDLFLNMKEYIENGHAQPLLNNLKSSFKLHNFLFKIIYFTNEDDNENDVDMSDSENGEELI